MNGKKLASGESAVLAHGDRVVIGQELMMFYQYQDAQHPHPVTTCTERQLP